MKIAIVCCAVLVGLGAGSAMSSPLRDSASWFTDSAPRPPRAVPHVRPHYSAVAPTPRPKPQAEPGPGPAPAPAAAANPPASPVFPPVTPLE